MTTHRPGLRFFNGTDTVGGVQVLASGRAGRVLFDLGVVGNPAIVRKRTLFNSLLRPRPGRELVDYLRAGMAPLVENLYDPASRRGTVAEVTADLRAPGFALAGSPLVTDVDPGTIAVFVSHLHEDHMRLLPYVAADVPVLMSDVSARLHRALAAARVVRPTRRPAIGVTAGGTWRVGDIVAEPVPVDHDIPGASGLLLTTPEGTIAYTGDWRLHGRAPELMRTFAERCAGADVLLTEASTVHAPGHEPPILPQAAERDVAELLDGIVATTERGVYCSFHERNMERHADIRAVAAARGRTPVVNASTYAIWAALAETGFPEYTPSGVAVWAGTGSEGAAPPGVCRVTAADVAADPRSFLCELRAEDRPRLLDVAAGPGDTYVYLDGYPHGPADPGWQVLETWVRHLGIRFETLSSLGHAAPRDLRWLVDAVRPGVVVPVHTNAPDHFPATATPVIRVRRGQDMALPCRKPGGVL